MALKESRAGGRRDRPPRRPPPPRRDPYATPEELAHATVCERCGAVCRDGRWRWGPPPASGVLRGLCPACERARDRLPAGTIRVPADFATEREELLGLLRRLEEAECAEHPLERLLDVRDAGEGELLVSTTGRHLARAIAHALERRFHARARLHHPAATSLLHVDWKR